MITLSEEDREWAGKTWDRIAAKVSAECDRVGSGIPYVPVRGRYGDLGEKDIAWWTNGFWPGLLWLLYHAGGEARYRDTARAVEERLDRALAEYEGLNHDVGFMWTTSAVLDYRLTGHGPSRVRALHAANILAGRYNPRGRFIRAWNGDRAGWIIIDCLMNLSILYWAAGESADPRFHHIAVEHADTALRHLLRPDGSCCHIGILDTDTGALLETPGGQGYAAGSSWTRGQAWAIYGFAISAGHTGEARYLEAAKRVAHYFIAALRRYAALPGGRFVPPVDFRAPERPGVYDSSAGLIAACGLLLIAELTGPEEAGLYSGPALDLLKAVAGEGGFCDWDPGRDSIVQNGATAWRAEPDELQVPLIYADYFLAEAVDRLLRPDLKVW
jgi:unsaturated chondroitin disaccharide hydrolase